MNTDGMMYIYTDQKSFKIGRDKTLKFLDRYADDMKLHGTRKECEMHEPISKEFPVDIVGCLKTSRGSSDSHESGNLSRNLSQIIEHLGVKVYVNSNVKEFVIKGNKVTDLKLDNERHIVVDKLVICAGTNSRNIGRELGWTVPIWPVKGYTLNVNLKTPIKNNIIFQGDSHLILTKIREGLRLSGYMIFTTENDFSIDKEAIEHLKREFILTTGLTNSEFSSYWACLRPCTPDDLPIIGKFPRFENVYINTGHGNRGSILAFSSAELISQLINGESPIIDPKPFDANRFYI